MNKKKIAIIGGGPAGFMAAVTCMENSSGDVQVDIFEKAVPLKTILYTGNGRCNLSNDITNFRELAANYPRGEKFLYSIFSRFGVLDYLKWLEDNGVKTYTQPDKRIFPKSDKAATIRNLYLKKAEELGINIINLEVKDIKFDGERFTLLAGSRLIEYDAVIFSTGGNKSNSIGYKLVKSLGHTINQPRPSLTSVVTKEKWVKELAGVSIKDAKIQSLFNNKKISELAGDFVFTHKGLAGPVIFNTTAYSANLDFSEQNLVVYKINFLSNLNSEELDKDMQDEFKKQSQKTIANVLKKYIPHSLAIALLKENNIDTEKKVSIVNAKERKLIVKFLSALEVKIIAPVADGEIVTAGGINLKEVNAKTMESKVVKNLYFCGEVLDVDGLCGGFNLQACWSTGYIAGISCL